MVLDYYPAISGLFVDLYCSIRSLWFGSSLMWLCGDLHDWKPPRQEASVET